MEYQQNNKILFEISFLTEIKINRHIHTVCQKNLCTKETNVKCVLHSRIPKRKSLHTFLHTFYNCTCLRPEGINNFVIATYITIITTSLHSIKSIK